MDASVLGRVNPPEVGQYISHARLGRRPDQLLLRALGRGHGQRHDQDVVARERAHQGRVVVVVDLGGADAVR